MNIVIFDWAYTALKKSKLGYTHQQVIEGDMDKVVEITKAFYAEGLNVMWLHGNIGAINICVDDRAFSQR